MDSDDPQITLVNRLLPQHEIEVLESFTMRGNWSGDVEKGFVAEIDIDESFLEHWVEAQRGDRLTPARVDAVLFVTEWFGNGQLDWFPPAADFLSADFYYLPVKVNQGVDYIDDSKLVFINPSTNKLYFSWVVF
ncbi:MAG: hypothetical protein GKR91_19380 [Pseudomonadales bacterium]|nr:hypothetical protein [Pseudomonadales bacterium]